MKQIVKKIVRMKAERACFSYPYARIHKTSYPVITPTAARGFFEKIFWKPKKFMWVIDNIYIVKSGTYGTEKYNGFNPKADSWFRDNGKMNEIGSTQYTITHLVDVEYIIEAHIELKQRYIDGTYENEYDNDKNLDEHGKYEKIRCMAERLFKKNATSMTLCAGLRRYEATYSVIDGDFEYDTSFEMSDLVMPCAIIDYDNEHKFLFKKYRIKNGTIQCIDGGPLTENDITKEEYYAAAAL